MRWALVAALLAAGCGPVDPCAGWNDSLSGDGGLILTASEHGSAWGQSACFQCHQAWRIHPPDCVGDGWLDHIDEAVDLDDSFSCTSCHGMNGTADEDWVDATSGAS